MKIYYSRCSTCQKALKWLDANHIQYELIDIKADHPSKEQLMEYFKKSGLPLKKFVNTSGQLYREMELTKKLTTMSEEEQLDLLASDGMLVKRPLLVEDDFILLGFKETDWALKLIK